MMMMMMIRYNAMYGDDSTRIVEEREILRALLLLRWRSSTQYVVVAMNQQQGMRNMKAICFSCQFCQSINQSTLMYVLLLLQHKVLTVPKLRRVRFCNAALDRRCS